MQTAGLAANQLVRGFSAINDRKSKTLNRLRETSLSSLLVVELNRPLFYRNVTPSSS